MKSNINTYMGILKAIATDFVLRRYDEMYHESISDDNIENTITYMIIDYHNIVTKNDIIISKNKYF